MTLPSTDPAVVAAGLTADQMLARLSIDQLRAGIARGRAQLALIDGLDESEDAFDGPFPPTKTFETWAANWSENRRRLLRLGIRDCEQELARRLAVKSHLEGHPEP